MRSGSLVVKYLVWLVLALELRLTGHISTKVDKAI